MKAAQKMHEHLSREVFPGSAVGLLHGRLPAGRKRSGDGAIQARRDQDSGVDHGDRSRRGRAECHGDGDRAGRALRPGAAAPASRARGPRRGAELLHPGDGKAERHGARAHPHAGGYRTTVSHRRDGHEAARARRIFRHQAIRAAGAAHRQHSARRGYSGNRAQRSAGFSWRIRRQKAIWSARSRTSAITGSGATDWCR